MKFADQLAEMLQWQVSEKTAYGMYEGIAFSVFRDINCAAHVIAWVCHPSYASVDTAIEFVRDYKKQFRLYGKPLVNDQSVAIQMNSPMGIIKPKEIYEFLPVFAAFLWNNGFQPTCAACRKPRADCGFYMFNGNVAYLCEDCAAAVIREKEEEIELSSEGNTTMGILGAVLGGIVGMIPWVILSFMDYVAAMGGLAIAWCAFYGYKLFHGKLNKRAFIILLVVLVVIVMTYVAAILSVVIAYAREGYYIPDFVSLFFTLLAAPFNGSLVEELWRLLAVSYLYSGLGTVALLFSLNKQLKSLQAKVRKAQK